jgi:hypothetical protein
MCKVIACSQDEIILVTRANLEEIAKMLKDTIFRENAFIDYCQKTGRYSKGDIEKHVKKISLAIYKSFIRVPNTGMLPT